MPLRSDGDQKLQRLSDTVRLYTPALNTGTNSDSPTLVILCTWYRAAEKHIAKYLEAYRQRCPTSRILLVESVTGDVFYHSVAFQQSRIAPALDVLHDSASPSGEVLLHVFSNGGSNTALHLAQAWRAKYDTPLPISSMMLDSCPGSPSIRLAVKATILSMPEHMRWWITIAVWLFIVPMLWLPSLLGKPNLVHLLREGLNNPQLIPTKAGRVYLCSAADAMVPIDDVVSHCAEALKAGYDAELIDFETSPHVSHMRKDEKRYWAAIEEVRKPRTP